MGSAAASPSWQIAWDRNAQIKAGLLAVAFVALFWQVLVVLQYQWSSSADWSHGPIIPLFSAYLVSLYWAELRRTPIRHTWVGFVLLVAALGFYQHSLWNLQIGYAKPLSMLLVLLGMLIALFGLPAMRWLFVPWAYLFFAIPLPKRIYLELTDPMRQWAASVATWVLSLFPDLYIQRVGSVIEYQLGAEVGKLGVEDACSGMRSAITLCAIGVAVAFMAVRPWWHRLVLLLACVPIAIFSNFIRVTVTCILHIYVGAEYATGTYHTVLGLVTLLLAFFIFAGLGWLLNNLFVETDDRDQPRPRPAAGGA
jgi:exosortase